MKNEKSKTVIVSGAAGFAGASLTRVLSDHGYNIYALVREKSDHNDRLSAIRNVTMIKIGMDRVSDIPSIIEDVPNCWIHLAWFGDRYDFAAQKKNIQWTLDAINAASDLGCSRFVCTGSQAEYGVTLSEQTEELLPDPFCAYGASKVAACYLSRYRAKELGIDWIWGRVFSLYGTYEPSGRMLPHLVHSLRNNEIIHLSSCRQNWDYLHVLDAAEAIVALMETGKPGEIYNIANGDYRPLKDYVEEVNRIIKSESKIIYGDDPIPYVSLQPSIEKIFMDTGWKPKILFSEGIKIGF